ncbi:MAG: copper resistance protein B [Pseudomonadota bacterium]|nr:copper resistance protein B [Pseudomonadota bacterium]
MNVLNQQSKCVITLLACANASSLYAMGSDDPFLTMLQIDQFEIREADENNPVVLEGEFWAGHDLNKFKLKADLEYVDSEFEEMQWQALYSKGISAYWNMQTGLRYDRTPEHNQTWAVFGFEGTAPYFLESDATFSIGEGGQAAVDISSEYELMLTQRLVLIPEVTATFYGHTLDEYEQGQGLANLGLGARLGYEIRREFKPYLGWQWGNTYGETKVLGGGGADWQFVVGISGWL